MNANASSIVLNNLSAALDCDLVTRAVAGREDGFEELVRRYQRPIAAYVYRMTGDYEAALDLTQEVFIKVYNSLARYRPEFKFSTWIYKIAHNSAVDHLRRMGPRTQELEAADGYVRPFATGAISPEHKSERKELR